MSRLSKLLASLTVVAALFVPLLGAGAPAQAATTMPASTTVIVQGGSGSTALLSFAVAAVGGSVQRTLDGVDGVVAIVPTSAVSVLAAVPGVLAVTPDSSLQLLGIVNAVTAPLHQIGDSLFGDDAAVSGRTATDDPGSLYGTDRMINADTLWRKGVTGKGIDVAVIDSGVSPVPGLAGNDKVVYGPDLSFDSQAPN